MAQIGVAQPRAAVTGLSGRIVIRKQRTHVKALGFQVVAVMEVAGNRLAGSASAGACANPLNHALASKAVNPCGVSSHDNPAFFR